MNAGQKEASAVPPFGLPSMVEHEAGLLDIFGIIRRRKGLIAFGTVLGLALAALYYFAATRVFEAQVEILVMQKDTNLPTKGVDARDTSPHDDLLSTHMQIFTSPQVIGQAVEEHRLDQLSSFAEARREAEEKGNRFNPVGLIAKNINVRRGGEGQARDARVLRATFRSTSPEDAATVLNAVVSSYQDFLGETFQNTSVEAVDLIGQAKEELEQQVADAQDAYQQFREEAPLFWEGDRTANPHHERLKEIERELTQVRIRRTQTTTRLEVIEEALSEDGAEKFTVVEKLSLIGPDDVARLGLVLSATRDDRMTLEFLELSSVHNSLAQTEHQRLLALLLREQEMQQNYGGDHPRLQRTREQIAFTRDYLREKDPAAQEQRFDPASLLVACINLLKHDLQDLARREGYLVELLRQEQVSAKQLVGYEVRNEMLRSDIERQRVLYDVVVARLREVNLIRDYGGFLTQILSPIQVPGRHASPRLLLVIALGGVLGVFCGTGLAYLAELTDRTFRNPYEVSRSLAVPLMADIPPIDLDKRKRFVSGNGQAEPNIDYHVVAYHHPRSRAAETIRGLRTALQFGTYQGKQKVIQITSPNAGDGKTTVTANLAVSLAQAQKRVLIVDADLRRPTQHKIFGIDNAVGLSDVINDTAELSDAIQTLDTENLWLLPSGPIPPNPAELLSLPRFQELLDLLRERYDVILIDSPPLLAVSDPSVIAARTEGVLLTIRITKNGAPAVVQAKQMLTGQGAEVLGVVVNGFQRDRHYGRYGYGSGYGSGYRYGSGYQYGYGYGNGYGDGNGHGDGNGKYYRDEREDLPTAHVPKDRAAAGTSESRHRSQK